jgi:hypothetical protein
MAEAQASHRRGLETKVVNSNITNERVGMLLGFIIALAAIAGGVYLISIDKDGQGLAAIIVAIGSLVIAFFRGVSQRDQALKGPG